MHRSRDSFLTCADVLVRQEVNRCFQRLQSEVRMPETSKLTDSSHESYAAVTCRNQCLCRSLAMGGKAFICVVSRCVLQIKGDNK